MLVTLKQCVSMPSLPKGGRASLSEYHLHYTCAHIPGKQTKRLGVCEEEGVCLWAEFHRSDLSMCSKRTLSSTREYGS